MSNSFVTTMQLNEIAKGAVQEQFEVALQEVMENIHDPNTPATKKRKIVLTIELEPTADRSFVETTVSYKTVTMAPDPIKFGVYTNKRGDRIVAGENIIHSGSSPLLEVLSNEEVEKRINQ